MKYILWSIAFATVAIYFMGCATAEPIPLERDGNDMIGVFTILKTDEALVPNVKNAIAKRCVSIGCNRFNLKIVDASPYLRLHYECMTENEP